MISIQEIALKCHLQNVLSHVFAESQSIVLTQICISKWSLKKLAHVSFSMRTLNIVPGPRPGISSIYIYRQMPNISRTKSEHLNVSRFVLQLS